MKRPGVILKEQPSVKSDSSNKSNNPATRNKTVISNLYKRSMAVPKVKRKEKKVSVDSLAPKLFTLKQYLGVGPLNPEIENNVFELPKKILPKLPPSTPNKQQILVGETPIKPLYFSSPSLCTPTKRVKSMDLDQDFRNGRILGFNK
jgi:hypothetical protein